MKRYEVYTRYNGTQVAAHYGPSLLGFLFGGLRHLYHGDWVVGVFAILLSLFGIVTGGPVNSVISFAMFVGFTFFSNQRLRVFFRDKYGKPLSVWAGSNREAIAEANDPLYIAPREAAH